MEDVNISIYRASVVREGSTPASPGFVVSEGQNPVDPSGSGQNHLPVTIATAATGLSITDSQVLGGAGTTSQYLRGDASLATFPDLTGYVPYTGANQTVNLNTQQLQAGHTTLTTNGSTETLTINHTSGSGKAINVTKGGAGEGLYVNKTSGSGNAATIVGTLEATTLVKTGGTSSQFLKADGSVDSTSYGTGTVTSVGLSSATSGVTIGSTPVTSSGTITLAIATASGSQNGLLSSTDWTTFNGKQNALTNPVTGTGTTNYLPKFTGSTTIGDSLIFDNGSNIGIRTASPISAGTYYTTIELKGATGGSGNEGGYYLTTDADGTTIGQLGVDGNFVYLGSRSNTDAVITSNNTERIRAFAGGNVHIGPIGATDNGARLQVSGSVTTMATITSSSTASGLQLTNTGSTASSWIIQSDGGAVSGQAALRFYSLTASNYRMSIDGSGNLGIGTTSPTARLSVQWDKSTAFAGSAVYDSQAFNVSNHGGTLAFGGTFNSGGSYTEWSAIGGMKSNTTDGNISGDINFYTRLNSSAMTQRMVITSGGNVGIGTTTPDVTGFGWKTLTIRGGTTSGEAGVLELQSPTTTGAANLGIIAFMDGSNRNAQIGVQRDSSNTTATMFFYTNGGSGIVERMRINSSGNVQVMAANQLQVFRSDNTRSGLFYCNNLAAIVEASTDPLRMSTPDRLEFYSGSSEKMRITSGGSVCINSTSPLDSSAKLNVSGNVYLGAQPSGAGTSTLKYHTSTGLVSFDTSARVFKKDILDLQYGLSSVLKMSSKIYKWKSNEKEDLGFIADEMFKIIPEVVYLADNNVNQTELKNGEPLGINYDRLIPVLVKAIQELKQEIDTLKN